MAYEQTPITGPFAGIVDNIPRPWKPKNAWDDLLNMLVWKGRLVTRPILNAAGFSPDGKTILNLIAFLDVLGFQHNLALTAADAYMITSGTPPVWNGPLLLPAWNVGTAYVVNQMVFSSGITYVAIQAGTGNTPATSPTFWAPLNGNIIGTGLPWGYAIIDGQVHFSNGSYPGLYADGSVNIIAETHPGAWRYAMTLASHLVTCFCTEPAPQVPGSIVIPNRVRWSASGSATQWVESSGNVATTAGHEDLLEVPDGITGCVAIGTNGYIFRSNGVTLMQPTGVGTAPFAFWELTNAPQGVGNKYPYSLDLFGYTAQFVAEQDIYTFNGATFTPVGGAVKKLIFADINAVTSPVQVRGRFMTRFYTGFDFLSYWLSLPNSVDGEPVTWVYNVDDNAWQRFRSNDNWLTEIGKLVL